MARKLVIFSIILVVFSVLPFAAEGAVLYLEPKTGEYHTGDTLIVEVRIDTQGDCINTVRADLAFANDILILEDFSLEDSILTHWVERPEITDINDINLKGKISFSGGIPGGYCGRIAGDPGLTNILGKIIFRIPSMIIGGTPENRVKIDFLQESKVFLNDGFGTEAELYTQGTDLVISDKAEPQKDEWEERLEDDNIPPEPFVVELLQDPAIFEGKYFIIFWTTDKQTGLDHFGVKEGEKDFKRTVSPYLLEDQTLNSRILVRAVDKAGNERVVEYIPSEHGYIPEPKKPEKTIISWLMVFSVVIVLALITVVIVKLKAKKKREKESENFRL
jgi:hypothetical protein